MNLSVFKTKLIERKTIAQDTASFLFEKPENFSFSAGQYIQFRVPTPDGEILRSYSIASLPSEPYLEFAIKLVPGGKATGFLFQCAEGAELFFQGPLGTFSLSSEEKPSCFIATGAGLAPIHALLKEKISSGDKNKISVLFGVRTEKNIFWQDRLEKWRQKFDNFSFSIVLSAPDAEWKGKTGHVTEHLNEFPKESVFYICGNTEMIKETRAKLINLGANPKNIKFEIF